MKLSLPPVVGAACPVPVLRLARAHRDTLDAALPAKPPERFH